MQTLSVGARFFGLAFILALLFLFSLPARVQAALLYFDPGEAALFRGDTVTLNLRIDTDEGECINTVDAVIKYDAGIRAVGVGWETVQYSR